MDKIKAKYKNQKWHLVINGSKSETKSLVKSIGSYIDALDKPQDMRFILKVLIEYRSGLAVFEMITCYATSDFTLPFIEELEHQINVKKLKLESFSKLKILDPDLEEDIMIDNDLLNKEYTVNDGEESKTYTLPGLTQFFKTTKILRKSRRIYFNSESSNMSVKLSDDTSKPMYKGFMCFDSEKASIYIEDFKKLLQLHDKVLNTIANSVED